MPTSARPTDHPPDPPADPVLTHERAHLAAARRELEAMRERTLALDAAGGDAVSSAFLAASLSERAASLQDVADAPLFFGRTDIGAGAPAAPDLAGRWYIGRRHVHDGAGDPVVVDWRADVSRAFYRATRTAPMGVGLRRRFGYDGGRLTAYEDEHLTDSSRTGPTGHGPRSRILAAEIERPRTGPMRDIVATIQPEQDVIVRTDIAASVCVQGAPGTGKTAVGLHRAAYLLYAHRDRLRRSGVLVVGPNRAFLSYIGQVLPALGEVAVTQVTVDALTDRVPVRGSDGPAAALLKGDPRLAAVVRRAVWSHLAPPAEALVVPRGARRWRVPAHTVSDTMVELADRGVRYSAGRTMLAQRLAHLVLVQMEEAGGSPDDREQDAVGRSRPVRAMVDAVWPALDPVRVVLRLLSDPAALAAAGDGILDPAEQALLRWPKAPRGPAAALWSVADAVLVDEAADVIDRVASLGHVVLDEAQDLSPMQLRAVGRRCSTGSATVLGDIAQGTTPWATASWAEALGHLGKPTAHVEVLDRGYRVPAAVIDFAARLLPRIAPGLAAPASVRDDPGRLDLVRVPMSDACAGTDVGALEEAVVAAARTALGRVGSVGVIAPAGRIAGLRAAFGAAGLAHDLLGGDEVTERLTLVPAVLAKGLEYDWVVVVEPAEVVAAEADERSGLRRLYVVLTRAVSGLAVVHGRPLPEELLAA